MFKYLLLVSALASAGVKSEIVGSINIGSDTVYVWRQFGTIYVDNGALVMEGDGRAYLLTNGGATTIQPDDFYQMQLSGKSLSYDVDLSRVPCHCNAAAFFNKMPAYDAGSGLDWYCDANYVGGIGCPEFDAIEANKHTVQTNLHQCGWDGNWFVDCDRGGCGFNSWDVDTEGFGVGKRIDTGRTLKFTHYQDAGYAYIKAEQDGEEFAWDDCLDANYVSAFEPNWADGMVFVFALWGDQDENVMGWLDDRTGCQPEGGVVGCDINNAAVRFSNFNLY